MTIAIWIAIGFGLIWTWGMLGRIHNTLKEIQDQLKREKAEEIRLTKPVKT